ncbi:MAG TPA: ATP-binding protein [Candidatus Saccharimonadales bacterium]|nr:ATP-binding protein [Candidatus Saccharimonadales bacterium]
MLRRFYKQYIAPRQGHEDAGNREFVLNVLVTGAAITMLIAQSSLVYNYFVLGFSHLLPTIISVFVMLAVAAGIYLLSRHGHYKPAAYSFVGLYFLIAVGVTLSWGLGMPVTVALFSLIVVLAGILIGAKHSLYSFGLVSGTVIILKIVEGSVYEPDTSWVADSSNSGTITGVLLVFGVIAAVSWLFNYRMERSLHRAERAEAALKRQKAQLEHIVEKRTHELQVAQLEKVQELYRFAELGQVSTALMHELANHLTTLTLDIESLEAENRSRMLKRAKRSIQYIDKMVLQVRDQLRGKTRTRTFSVISEIKEVLTILQHKASRAAVNLVWEAPQHETTFKIHGDALRFRQLLANLISNAIDAYDEDDRANKQVVVSAAIKKSDITIQVEDWGKGIALDDRAKLFDPFYGRKKGGLGLGLFIARQIAQDHFGGTITLDANKTHTVFVITLRAYDAHR